MPIVMNSPLINDNKAPPAVVTIGDGVSSVGLFNCYDGQNTIPLNATLRAALAYSRDVFILQGSYTLAGSVSVPYDGARISMSADAVITVDHSGSVGFLDITGDRVRVEGGKIISDTFVANQRTILATAAHDITVRDVLFQMDTTTWPGAVSPNVVLRVGDTTTPMVALDIVSSRSPKVLYNTFLPNHAWVCCRIEEGSGHRVIGNDFTNGVDSGLGALDTATTAAGVRLCYIGIHLEGTEWGEVSHNRFWGLGESYGLLFKNTSGGVAAAQEVFAAIIVNQSDTQSNKEQGHSTITNNFIEAVNTPGAIRLYGINEYVVNNNQIGLLGILAACPNATGEAALITGKRRTTQYSNDFATEGSTVCFSLLVQGNRFHNNGTGDGAAIYLDWISEFVIVGNSFGIQVCNYQIWVNSPNVGGGTIQRNYFRALVSQANAIRIAAGTLLDGIFIGHNTLGQNYTGELVSDAGAAGAAGRRKILTGIQDTGTGNDNSSSLTTNVRLDQ